MSFLHPDLELDNSSSKPDNYQHGRQESHPDYWVSQKGNKPTSDPSLQAKQG